MLGAYYRFVYYNGTWTTTGGNAISTKAKRWNFSLSGLQTWEGVEANLDGGGSLGSGTTSGSYISGGMTDNTTNAYLGGTFRFQLIGASGSWTVYLQNSTNSGANWGDFGTGRTVAVVNMTTSGLYTTEVEL